MLDLNSVFLLAEAFATEVNNINSDKETIDLFVIYGCFGVVLFYGVSRYLDAKPEIIRTVNNNYYYYY